MTPAERQRLYRRRKAGLDTSKMTLRELADIVRVIQRPGPAPLFPGVSRAMRKQLRMKQDAENTNRQ